MWRKSISDQYVDDYSQIWKNIGETYTHLRKDGSSTFFYQKTNDAGELSLASHAFSANEMAGFGLFHSQNAREAGMLNHVNPTLGTFVNMVAQEMAAQWTDPYLLTAGAAILMRPITVKTPQYTKSSLKQGQAMHKLYHAGEAGKEFTKIPGIRPDYVDINTQTIYELKPNNPRATLQGKQQLQRYKRIFEQVRGGVWNTHLDTY